MSRRVALAVLIGGALHCSPAAAGLYISGTDLYADCATPRENPVFFSRTERCTGFISGVVDATEGLRSLAEKPYCIPPDVTLGDLNIVIIEYLQKHAATRNMPASSLVMSAMDETYHCPAVIPQQEAAAAAAAAAKAPPANAKPLRPSTGEGR